METLRERVLTPIGISHAKLRSTPLAAFLAAKGVLYTGALMVVGRATNGWHPAFSPSQLATRSGVDEYVNRLSNGLDTSECPVRVICERWGAGSAFWRVIRNVVRNLKIAKVEQLDWSSHLVWSNLYKVAPADGKNPGVRLGRLQREGCLELFRVELTTYSPKKLLLLTGIDWATDFLKVTGAQTKVTPLNRHVQGVGAIRLHGRPDISFVVATHPQGKPEAEWVDEVIRAFHLNEEAD